MFHFDDWVTLYFSSQILVKLFRTRAVVENDLYANIIQGTSVLSISRAFLTIIDYRYISFLLANFGFCHIKFLQYFKFPIFTGFAIDFNSYYVHNFYIKVRAAASSILSSLCQGKRSKMSGLHFACNGIVGTADSLNFSFV